MKNQKLLDRRNALNLTQAELAKKTCVSIRAYQQYEYGIQQPNAGTAIRIAQALDTTVEHLWDGNPTEK